MKSQAIGSLGSRVALEIFLAFALLPEAGALSVRIAPLVLVEAPEGSLESLQPERELLKKLDATPLSGSVGFSLAERVATPPLSFLDAARLCELHEYPFLIYGYLRKRESVYTSELKLLSREGKRIAASFVATDDLDHYDRLIADLTRKIADYFLEELAVAPGERTGGSARNLFELPFAVGYWAPAGKWSEGVTSVCCVDLGLRFLPRKPMCGLKSRPFYLGIGLEAEYALGQNRPECETAHLHRIQARLPFEFFVQFSGGNVLSMGLGGLAEFDVLRQERKYGETYVESRSSGGILASLGYRHALSERVALALEFGFDSVFYSPPLNSFSSKLAFEYSFAKRRSAEAD